METNKKQFFLNNLTAYALVLPAFIVVMLVVAYPIASSVAQSFTDGKAVHSRWKTTVISSPIRWNEATFFRAWWQFTR
jgi:ABC-type sugar transport system permease subunit